MPRTPDRPVLEQLIDAAYHQTLARFESEVADGRRDSHAELTDYRRRRRDYASLLRSGRIPEEAQTLAERLLQSHKLATSGEFRSEFEKDVARMLIRLYDAFAAHTEAHHGKR